MKDNQNKVDQFTAQLRKLRKEVNENVHSPPTSDTATATEAAAEEVAKQRNCPILLTLNLMGGRPLRKRSRQLLKKYQKDQKIKLW